MSPRAFHALVAALIRIGLLLALAIMLMAENAQARPFHGPNDQAPTATALHLPGGGWVRGF